MYYLWFLMYNFFTGRMGEEIRGNKRPNTKKSEFWLGEIPNKTWWWLWNYYCQDMSYKLEPVIKWKSEQANCSNVFISFMWIFKILVFRTSQELQHSMSPKIFFTIWIMISQYQSVLDSEHWPFDNFQFPFSAGQHWFPVVFCSSPANMSGEGVWMDFYQ